MSEHEGLALHMNAAPEAGRWNVVEAHGGELGQVQELPGSNLAQVVGYEGYTFNNRWTAAYALALGTEMARQEMAMIGY